MTPQEKAKELVSKFSLNPEQPFYILSQNHIKQCALIAVEEMQNQFNQIEVSHIVTGYISYKDYEENLTNIQDQLDSKMISKWNYWEEVKHEIEKL